MTKMRKGITVRKIGINDLKGVYALGRTIFAIENRHSLPWDEKNIAEVLADDMDLSFIAMLKKKIVGFIIASDAKGDNRTKRIKILWFGVDGALCHEGTGEMLADALKKEAHSRNTRTIAIEISSEKGQLIDILKKFGFTETEEILYMEKNF